MAEKKTKAKAKKADKPKSELANIERGGPTMRVRALTMQMPSLRSMGAKQPPMRAKRLSLPSPLGGKLPRMPSPLQQLAAPAVGGGDKKKPSSRK